MTSYRLLSLAVLTALLLSACGSAAPAPTTGATALPPVASDAAVISQARVRPHRQADLAFTTPGRVAEVLVQEGDRVEANQVVARLVNNLAAESTAAGAQQAAAVATAQQAVAAAQQQVAGAQQAWLAAQTEVVNAHKAITDLVDSTTDALNLAQAESDMADLQRQIDDSKRNLGYLVSPDLKYYQDQVKRAQDALTNAQQNATLVDIGQIQAQLREAQKALETATNVYNNAKDGFADCPSCEKVWAYDRMISWQDAVSLYADAGNLVQQLQLQIDQNQRGSSLAISAAQDNLTTVTNRMNYYLKGPDAVKVNQAQANLGRLEAQLAKAQADAAELKANNGVDPDQLKAARDRAATAEASLATAQAALATAQAAVTAAQANLAAAQLPQDSIELKAPFAGTVAVQNLRVGEYIAPGQTALTLADFSLWEVQTDDLTELEVVKIQLGQTAEVKLDALPDVALPAVVKAISPKYEEKRGDITYTITLGLTDPPAALRWGMTAEVTFKK